MNRREFLQAAGACSLSFLMPGIKAWALSNGQEEPGGGKVIVVFLRGARATCGARLRNRGVRGHSGPLPVQVRGAPLQLPAAALLEVAQ